MKFWIRSYPICNMPLGTIRTQPECALRAEAGLAKTLKSFHAK